MEWEVVYGCDLITYELAADPRYYVERWDYQAWAAYVDDRSIGEPGTYGTRQEAQEAALTARQAEVRS